MQIHRVHAIEYGWAIYQYFNNIVIFTTYNNHHQMISYNHDYRYHRLLHNLWSEHVLLVVKMAEGSGDSFVRKKKATSVVWEDFQLKTTTEDGLKKEEKNGPVCMHCSKSVPAK